MTIERLANHYTAKNRLAKAMEEKLLMLAKNSGKNIVDHPVKHQLDKLCEYLIGLSDAAELLGVADEFEEAVEKASRYPK